MGYPATRNEATMSKVRVSITMSLDGYVAGPDQNEENPLGSGGLDLHSGSSRSRRFGRCTARRAAS